MEIMNKEQQEKIEEKLFEKALHNSNCNLGELSWTQINNIYKEVLK